MLLVELSRGTRSLFHLFLNCFNAVAASPALTSIYLILRGAVAQWIIMRPRELQLIAGRCEKMQYAARLKQDQIDENSGDWSESRDQERLDALCIQRSK